MMRTIAPLFLATLAAAAQESAPDAAVVALRETISGIVEVDTRRSKERADWKARKASMNELLELQRRELGLLEEELDKAGGSADEFAARKEETEASIARFREARRAVRAAAARVKPRVTGLAERFPEPLLEEVEGDLATLQGWSESDEPREALQAVLGIVAAAEQFNRRITREVEVRESREVEVLYLGLARAYYADRNGRAGVGVPGPDGWEWTARPELADPVNNALDQLDRKRPPELVELPVEIMEGGGQ